MGAGSGRGNRRLATLVFAMVVLSLGPVFTIGGVVLAVPSVSSVTVVRENPTSAELSVAIADAGTAEKTVQLRYKVSGSQDPWNTVSDVTTGSTAPFNLTGLAPDTTYAAEANVDSSSWSSSEAFTTLPGELGMRNVAGFFAADTYAGFSFIVIEWNSDLAALNNSGGIRKNLYVRYYAELSSYPHDWIYLPVKSDTRAKPGFRLNNLTPDTGYHVEASLDSDYSDSYTATIGFRTDGKARVSYVGARDITQTSAEVDVRFSNLSSFSDPTAIWRYRVKGTDWPSGLPNDTTMDRNGGTISLTGLTPNTEYEVQASLEWNFSIAKSDEFTTASPGLEPLDVVDKTQTGAKVVATVTDPNDAYQMAKFRHCTAKTVQGDLQCDGQWSTSEGISITTDANTQVRTASRTLSGLTADTTYLVQVSLQSDFANPDTENSDGAVITRSTDFKTKLPKVTAVTVSEKKTTSAKATATIEHFNRREQTVFMRYRAFTESGGVRTYKDWEATEETTSSTSTAEHKLTNLRAGKDYQVQMWIDPDLLEADRKSAEFKTTAPSVSGVVVDLSSVTQTAATVKVTIDAPTGADQTVHLRYGVEGADKDTEWTKTSVNTDSSDAGMGTSVDYGLMGLTSDTTYVVEASLDGTFQTGTVASDPFKTKLPGVSAVVVDLSSVTQTAATVTVTIDKPNGADQTVHLRYGVQGADKETEWTKTSVMTDGSVDLGASVDYGLMGLTSDTTYVVEASLDGTFQTGTVASEPFTTDPPLVDGVTVGSVSQTTATVTVTIDEPNGRNLQVFWRYGTPVQGQATVWTVGDFDVFTDGSSADLGASVEFGLMGLTSDTTYVVEASLDDQFPTGETVASEPFTTEPPKLLKVRVIPDSETMATATVTITGHNGTAQRVNLRYRTAQQGATPPGAWSSPVETADPTGESATIALSGLTGGTLYDVEAWLVRDASHVVTTNFTTLPGIRGITMQDIEQITATAVVTFDNPDAVNKVIYLRYGIPVQGQETVWTKKTETTDLTNQSFGLSGLTSGTLYIVQASIDDFTTFQPATFTTVPPLVGEAEVVAGSVTQTGAIVRVTILEPNGEDRTVHLRYGKASDVANKASWPVLHLDANGASVDFDMGPTVSGGLVSGGLVSGTAYLVEAFTDPVQGEQEPRDTTDPPIEFTTKPPVVGGVEVIEGDPPQTEATVRVTIDYSNGETRTVYLRYGKKADEANKASWVPLPMYPIGGSADFDLSGLTSGTEYVGEVYTDPFEGESASSDITPVSFTTRPPVVGAVEIVEDSVSQTGATVRVTIDHSNGEARKVYVRYGEKADEANKASWPVLHEDPTGGSVDFDLSTLVEGGLTSGTEYLVEAYTDPFDGEAEPRDTTSEVFTTKYPDIANVTITNKTSNRAIVTVIIGAPNGIDQRVYMRYRRHDPDDKPNKLVDKWPEELRLVFSADDTAEFKLVNLNKNQRYEVNLSILDSRFAVPEDVFEIPGNWEVYFTTSLLYVRVEDITATTAVVRTDIAIGTEENTSPNPESDEQQVFMRYGRAPDPQSQPEWLGSQQGRATPNQQDGSVTTKSEQDGSVTTKDEEQSPEMISREFPLSGLTPSTKYQVEVSLNDFEEDSRVIEITEFVTLPRSGNTGGGNTGGGNTGGGNTGGGNTGGGGGGRPPLQVEYTDVPDGHTHKEAIDALAAEGIFVGTECRPGEFCPEKPIPRWVMAVWLVRLIDGKEPEPVTESSFVDVNPGKWWAAHVERLWDLRITIGCWDEPGDFRYCPEASTTRAQMASFLVRMYKFAPAVSAGFVDTAHTSHRFDIDSLYAVGVTKGCFVNPLRYCPEEPTSRGEMATFLYRTRLHLGTTS